VKLKHLTPMKTKIIKSAICTSVFGFFWLATLCRGQGTLIGRHLGANNPTLEGFSAESFGTPQTGGLTNDLGFDAWFTSFNGGVLYKRSFGDLSVENWVLSATLRIVSPGIDPRSDTFEVSIETGSTFFIMWFGSDSVGNPIVQVTSYTNHSPAITLTAAGSTYNSYQLVYSAAANTADLWINGTEEFGGIPGSPLATSPKLAWGGGYQGAAGYQANWNAVSLEIVPEPSALSLFGLGAFCFAARRFRRRPKTV